MLEGEEDVLLVVVQSGLRMGSLRNTYIDKVMQLTYYYHYYYSIWMSLVTDLFFLVLLLNQRWSPPLRLQVSHCSTFRIMCDVPSMAVFCNESTECFPGTASKFFLTLLVTIPVAPIIIIIIIIIIRYGCLLSQAFSAWYFSWTSDDPHRSVFKFHTAVLSVLCVMFQV